MSHPAQVAQIWKQAIARYEQITKKKLEDPALRSLTTVDGLLGAIEVENTTFSDFREKRHGIFAALKYAMLPIELVGDLAAGGASMAFPPSSLVFGAVNYLINAARGVSAKYEAIVELMSTLKDFTIRLEVYAQQEVSDHLRRKLADILTTLLEVFAISRHQIERGRLLSFGKNILLGNDDGKAAIEKLAKLVDTEKSLVGAETLTAVKVANVTINRVDHNVVELTNRIADMNLFQAQAMAQAEETQEKGHRDLVKRVLRPSTSADDRYSTINRTRVPSTGDWIRDEQHFQEWINKNKPVLWVTGTPGAGKSYISSNIITYLKERHPQNVQHPSHVSVAYFFFKDDNPKSRSFHQALRDIAFKISQNDPMYAKHIAACVDSIEDISTLQSLWQKLYVDFFIQNDVLDSSVYIVLDALDEAFAEDRQAFFELLEDIQPGGQLQLLMLGRPHVAEEMDGVMEALSVSTIYVSDLNNSDDIVRYIRSSISKSVYLKRASKSLQSEIVTRLSTEAQGMFIWVDFMLKELLKKRDEGRMRKALDEAPKGLSQMIRHVLKGLSESMKDSPQYADDLNEMLAWITCAQRPLTLHELDNILKWRSEDGEGWIWLEGSLRRQFASFFLLSREDGLTTADLQRMAAIGAAYDMSRSFDDEDAFEDPDNPLDFDSDPRTTTVAFNHASLGDFFRSEGEGKVAAEDCPPIGVDYLESNVLVFKRYIEIISWSEDSSKAEIAAQLLPVACTSILPTLKAIDIAKCDGETKQAIGFGVARLLSQESVLRNFVGHVAEIVYTKEHLDLFMKWLSEEDVQRSLPSDERAWFDGAVSENTVDIFLRCIKFIAKRWLQENQWSGPICCKFIVHFLDLRNGTPALPLDSPEKVIEAAEWCGFERNQLWYRRIAMTLRDLLYWEASIEYFQKAIDLEGADPDSDESWLLRAGMAKTYTLTTDFAKAIEQDTICVQELEGKGQPERYKFDLHTVYERLGSSNIDLGDVETGLSMYRKAFQYNSSCDECAWKILECLNDMDRFDEIISMLKDLNYEIPDKECTRLSDFLIASTYLYDDLIDRITAAAYQTGNTSFVIDIYADAVAAAHKQRKSVQAATLELNLGTLYYTYGHDSERAARIWERLINTYRGNKQEGEIMSVLDTASNLLATYYLTQAMNVGVHTAEGQRYGKMLELLAAGNTPRLGDCNKPANLVNFRLEDGFVTTGQVGLVLGNFYKVCGREEATACYKAQVKECLRILSDDDPTNDILAFIKISGVLAAIGDDDGVISMCYQLAYIPDSGLEDEDDIENNQAADGENKEPDKGSFTCSGCSKFIHIDGTSSCRYCEDVLFCGTCMPLLKSKSLPVNVCGENHDWVFIPPRPEAVQQRGKEQRGMLWMQGGWITLDEFKNRLQDKWGITDKL
ncbi:tetratricopeptide repeat domain protein [Aspergillus coremiiformis]|uniref:Tetratricopeptide repeat domain protein n=1 Tax=Aspergillus coremiiformis TaxID=138285 RepID=A0A5N6ZGY4_9EURO|nr:tetratricopeptide repeat domain protein [Aspergillus coremiiformis]